MACAAILIAVTTVAAFRRAGGRIGAVPAGVLQSLRGLAALDATGRPPPPRYALCVIRH